MPLRRRLPQLILAMLLAMLAPGMPAQDVREEYQVKAAYLFNFAKFVEWPAQAFRAPDAPLVLCVAGRDPFGGVLAAYERRIVHGRELRVRRNVAVGELRGCHLLYVSESEERRLAPTLAAAVDMPVVTVSDLDGFIDAGGMIGLVEADARIQFEVNLGSASRAGIRVSAQLLRLARRVRGSQ